MGNYAAATTVEATEITTTLDSNQLINDVAVTTRLHGPSGMTYADKVDLGTPTSDVQTASQPAALQVLAAAQAMVESDFATGTTFVLQSITYTLYYSPTPVKATLLVTMADATTQTVESPTQVTAEVMAAVEAGTVWVEQELLAHYGLTAMFGTGN